MAKSFVGVVSSDKAHKSIVVTVQTHKTHPIYKKQYVSTKNFMAHDETNQAKKGDKVLIEETKPLSARKRFILKDILNRAAIQHTEASIEVPGVASKDEQEEQA
ncbi:MAG: 30S ribosomal protein S17 [Candidatus Saccharibacteria bacterium]|nr:30S ribosomal protein S17 [Candidatus Saccharibacteria bacterium]